MQLHLVRHGQTHWNALRRIQGQLDSELDDTGRAQASALVPHLAALGIGAVYCSTSLRTRQTLDLAFNPNGAAAVPVVYRDELREICLGVWEGRLWNDIESEFPEQVEHLRAVTPGFDVEGAESYVELQRRGVAAIERIIDENAAEVVLVVSHGALLKTVLAHYAGQSLSTLATLPSLANCAHSCLQANGAERTLLEISGEPFGESVWNAAPRRVTSVVAPSFTPGPLTLMPTDDHPARSTPSESVLRKRTVLEGQIALAEGGLTGLRDNLRALHGDSVAWRGPAPLDELDGIEAVAEHAWQPLMHALPDLERRDEILIGGSFEGRDYVAMVGHFCGTFTRDWLGIPATGKTLFVRYGEVHQVENGRISQSNCLWDLLDVMRQAGHWPIAPSLGQEGRWSGPLTADGLVLRDSDPEQSAASLAQTLAMQKTLGDYNDATTNSREGLLAMPQIQHWHPRMMWYGPAGIGTTRGLEGFVDHHQLPFRLAFPNRKGGSQWDQIAELRESIGGGHYVRLGDGAYSLTGGWPSVHALHVGPDWLGLGPTGREVNMRVMDFYLHHEGRIRENWVPLDIIDILRQLGVDVFDRLRFSVARR